MDLLKPILRARHVATLTGGLLLLAAAVLGSALRVELLPEVDVPVVNVVTHLPGASSEDVELLVTLPVEDAVRTAPSVRLVSSRSLAGISLVTVEFSWDTRLLEARQIVQAQLARSQSEFPPGATPRISSVGSTMQQVAGWVLHGPMEPADLRLMARRELSSQLTHVEGVERVEVVGGEQRAIWITVKPELLAALNLTVSGLSASLEASVGTRFAGYLEIGDEDIVLRGDSRPASLEEVQALPVELPSGGTIPLREIASVEAGYAPRHYSVAHDGIPAVALQIFKQRTASALRVSEALRAARRRIAQSLPRGVRLEPYYDQGDVLRSIQDGFRFDLAVGAGLASLIVFLFLGDARSVVAVISAIPLILCLTGVALRGLHESLNAITVSALTLAVGLVVDDAVVVTESIRRRASALSDPTRSVSEGLRAVLAPDVTGTLTTVAAYAPLLVIGGLGGLFLRPFAATVIVAVSLSLLLSVSLIPAWLAGGNGRRSARWNGVGLERLQGKVDGCLRKAQRHRRLTLAIAFVAAASGVLSLAARHGAVTLLPPVDESSLLVEYVLPDGVSLRESERIAGAIETSVRALPGVRSMFRRVGSPAGGLQIEGVDRGEILVRLEPAGPKRPPIEELAKRLRGALAGSPEVPVLVHQPTQERIEESFSGLPALFGLTLYGPNMAMLQDLARSVAPVLRETQGVRSVIDPTTAMRRELSVRIDPLRSAAMGVSPRVALDEVEALSWGRVAARVLRPRRVVPLIVRIESLGNTRSAVATLPVTTGHGDVVPLSAVATVREQNALAVLTRTNGSRTVQLLADVEGNLPAIASRAEERLRRTISLPPGYSFVIEGQFREIWAVAKAVGGTLVAGAGLVLLVLWLHFRSLRPVFWIGLTAAAALSGAGAALALGRTTLDVGVAVAAVTLVGIAVNNGIVLVDFARRDQGARSAEAALRGAATQRLRPILITSLTTIAALAPSALAIGPGQHFFHAFSVAVIGGLCVSTAATLLVLPVAIRGSLRRLRRAGDEGGMAR